MRKIGDFFKRIKVTEQTNPNIEENSNHDIEIEIEGNINLFKNEKEKIIQGAKQLLEIGKAENMEDAIKAVAVIFRGLTYKATKIYNGKTVIVLIESAHEIDTEHDEIRE